MYRFEVPKRISAVDEIKLRYGGWDSLNPIAVLLIKAGYGDYAMIDCGLSLSNILTGGTSTNFSKRAEWAEIHSEEWRRYQFDRWDEFKGEIWEGINQRRNDPIKLRKYIGDLLLPFSDFHYYENIHRYFDIGEKSSLEAKILVSEYCEQSSFSINDFVSLWKRAVNITKEEDKYAPLPEYEELLKKNLSKEMYSAKINSCRESEEAAAFRERDKFPYNYAGRIAGCLLENNVEKEYIDYQKDFGVYLVDGLTVSDVADSMGNWTDEAVLSLNPKTLIDLDVCVAYSPRVGLSMNREILRHLGKNEKASSNSTMVNRTKDISETEIGRVSFGEFPQNMPELLKRPEAVPYWEEAFKQGLIDEHFNFKIDKCGTGALVWFSANMYLALTGHIDIIESDNENDKRPPIKWKIMKQWQDCKECDYASTYDKIKKKKTMLFDYRKCIRNIFIGKLNGQKDGEEVKK